MAEKTYYLQQGRAKRYLGLNFSFGTPLPGHVNFFYQNDELMVQLPSDGEFMRMADRFQGSVKKDSIQPLMLRSLYMVNGQNFVIPILNEKYPDTLRWSKSRRSRNGRFTESESQK